MPLKHHFYIIRSGEPPHEKGKHVLVAIESLFQPVCQFSAASQAQQTGAEELQTAPVYKTQIEDYVLQMCS